MLRKILLACGILSSLLYVGIDVLAAVRYGDYHSFTSQAISELAAVGAPTKHLVDPLFIAYDVLLIAFGVGVWTSPARTRALHLVAGLLIAIAAVGLVWPPMQLRGTDEVSGDAPHIAVAGVEVLLILLTIGFGGSLQGRRFLLYSHATLTTILLSGALTGFAGSRLAAGEPTPWLGVAERINVGAYLVWVLVLAVMLLRSTIPSIEVKPASQPPSSHYPVTRTPLSRDGPNASDTSR